MSREPPIGKPNRAAFSISRAFFISASLGSAAVSKTVCRGFDSLRRCVCSSTITQVEQTREADATAG